MKKDSESQGGDRNRGLWMNAAIRGWLAIHYEIRLGRRKRNEAAGKRSQQFEGQRAG